MQKRFKSILVALSRVMLSKKLTLPTYKLFIRILVSLMLFPTPSYCIVTCLRFYHPGGLLNLVPVTSLPITHEIMQIIDTHPIGVWARRQAEIKTNFHIDGGITPNEKLLSSHKGEAAQSSLLTKYLRHLFPQSTFSYGPIYSAPENPYGNTYILKILDSSESYLTLRDSRPVVRSKYELEMSMLKIGTTYAIPKSRAEIKQLLGLDANKPIVSLYTQSLSQYSDTFVAFLKAKLKEQILILNFNYTVPIGDQISQAEKLFSIPVRRLSEATKSDYAKIYVNDSTQRLPYVFKASDLSVVVGPINFLESISVGTPTIVVQNERYTMTYEPNSLKKMIAVAERSGIAKTIYDWSDLESAARILTAEEKSFLAPHLIEIEGKSSIHRVLDNLLEALKNQ